MAAVSSSNPLSHNRLRSSSDPFVDPSSYPAIPTKPLTSTRNQHRQPALPPKSSRVPSAVQKSAQQPREITEAVRETVTVRHIDQSSRAKMARSQTALSPAPASNNSRHNIGSGRRSHSQDSVTAAAAIAVDKGKSAGKHRPKKGSQHADVIDRLDFTGVGPMFHHDGPFDACAPSRNRHRTKAPMLAWSSRTDGTQGHAPGTVTDPYENYEPPKKKVDAIAEAWGIHEPEPFEEFSAGGNSRLDGDTPASSIYAGKEGHSSGPRTSTSGKRKDSRDSRDYYRDNDGLQLGGRHATNRRSVIPPPQPVFVPDSPSDNEIPLGSPPAEPSRVDGPKRTKSIMQRIRKMRDAPNVPITDDFPVPLSPTSGEGGSSQANAARPTHRSQHSFLGRFAGGRTSVQKDNVSESPEAFVYIEDSRNQNKDLPPPPTESPPDGEIEVPQSVGSGPQSPGLGRKGSLLRKVRGVVKGTK